MTDKELLEYAAKAGGIELDWDIPPNSRTPWRMTGEGEDRGPASEWSSLNDGGDTFRLAVALRIAVKQDDDAAVIVGWLEGQPGAPTRDGLGPWYWKEWLADNSNDRDVATRRAITRAAAELGRAAP